MKKEKKEEAIKLRNLGYSFSRISDEIGIGKGTLSVWLKDIKPILTEFKIPNYIIKSNDQLIKFEDKILDLALNKSAPSMKFIADTLSISPDTVKKVIDKHNISLKDLRNKEFENNNIIFFEKYREESLFMLGLGLYWGEGSKSPKTNSLSLVNSDYGIIQQWLKWCKTYLPDRKLRYTLHIHETSDLSEALCFWKEKCDIEDCRYYTLKKRTEKDDSLVINKMPNGTMEVCVREGSHIEYLRMMQWLEILRND